MEDWRLNRLAVALGGLVILIGIVMIGIFILARWDMADLNTFLNSESRRLFLWILLAIGLLDLISGIILAYEQK